MKTCLKTGRTILFAVGILTIAAFPVLADNDKHEGDSDDVDVTITGFISDSMCGLDHTEMMAKHGGDAKHDEEACVRACVQGGAKYVLADRAAGKTYSLTDQDKVEKFAGKRVLVEGEIEDDGRLNIHKIKLAP